MDALISIRRIERLHFSTVTLIASLFGAALGAGLWAISKPLASSLGDSNFAPIMRAMAVLPLIQAMTIAPMAAAQREMRFESLTIRTVISAGAGGVVGLVAALAGFGVWALVWQSLVQRMVAAVVLWVAVPTLLSLSITRRHVADVAEFALPNMLSRVMSWASGQVPRLILSMVLGPTKLGIFTLATRLNDIVTQVAILPKATVARVDLRRFAVDNDGLPSALREIFVHIGWITFPLCIGGAVIVRPLICVWLDSRWHDAVLSCQLMLLIGIPFVSIYVSASLLLAFNRQRLEALICAGQSVCTIAGAWIGASYGVSAAVAAIVFVAVATVPLVVIAMWRSCGVRVRDVLLPQVLPLLAAASMGGAILLCRPWFHGWFAAKPELVAEFATGAVSYLLLATAMQPELFISTLKQAHWSAILPTAQERDGGVRAPPPKTPIGLEP